MKKLGGLLRSGGPLLGAAVFLGGFYLFVKLLLPLLGGWLASPDWFSIRANLPSSGKEVPLYMGLALLATGAVLTYDNARWRRFNRPIEDFLRWKSPVRIAVLVALPLLFGGAVFADQALGPSEPGSNPLRHPTPPDRFSAMESPYRTPGDELLEAFDEALRSGEVDPDESSEPLVREYAAALESGSGSSEQRSAAYRRHIIEQGRVLFMINCRPCHGTRAMGDGPMSLGQRRQPADFSGVETIATLVEGAVFWRIQKGGLNLPREGAPWESAMPQWEHDLTDEQIWMISMAEYDLVGNSPRQPEGRDEAAGVEPEGE